MAKKFHKGCTCGSVVEAPETEGLVAAWKEAHHGSGHEPCSIAQADRIARRALRRRAQPSALAMIAESGTLQCLAEEDGAGGGDLEGCELCKILNGESCQRAAAVEDDIARRAMRQAMPMLSRVADYVAVGDAGDDDHND